MKSRTKKPTTQTTLVMTPESITKMPEIQKTVIEVPVIQLRPTSIRMELRILPPSGTTPTDLEMVDLARAERADIAERIATGLIPPEPTEHVERARWYDQHLRCLTPDHRYFIRVRGWTMCASCLASARTA